MTNKIIGKVFDSSITSMEKAMTMYWRRNQALSSNVANVETPQYRAVDLDFKSELERAFDSKSASSQHLQKTDMQHLDLKNESAARYIEDFSGATKADGNNVDLDIQMGKLVFNAGKYSAGASIIRKKMQMLRFAIQQAMR